MIRTGFVIALLLALGASTGALFQQQRPTQFANAQESSPSCQQVYGGGATCLQTGKVILNKTIQHPNSSQLVESLSVNDPKFKADQTVVFHLTLTNTDTKEAKNITVQDTLPDLLHYISGDGQFDEKTRSFSFTVALLNPGESKTRIIQMRVLPAEKLPKDPESVCVLNQATATYGNGNVSQDNVQFCIENRVLGTETNTAPTVYAAQQVAQTPPTGAESLKLLALLPAGLAGLLIRKSTRVGKEVSE